MCEGLLPRPGGVEDFCVVSAAEHSHTAGKVGVSTCSLRPSEVLTQDPSFSAAEEAVSALRLRDGSKEVNLPWQRNWEHCKYMHMALRYCLCPKRLSHKLSVSTSLPDSQGALGLGSGGTGQPPLLIR